MNHRASGRAWVVALLAGCLWLHAGAHAQARTEATAGQAASPALKAELSQMRVQMENGKEVLKPVQAVAPGDVIEYRMVYTNQGSRTVRDVNADLPLVEGLEYIPKSASPARGFEVAARDRAFSSEPLMREQGGQKVVVPASQYRFLRWTLPQLPAGGRAEVSARVRVSGVSSSRPGGDAAAAAKTDVR